MPSPDTGPRPAGAAPLRIDLGIFARDERESIGHLIADLGRQEIMAGAAFDLRVLVLANGCRDDTAARARAAVAALPPLAAARFQVFDLTRGGKSRTVHHFIHALSRADADLLGLMDADIRLPRADTLLRMAQALAARPGLRVFNSRPVKDLVHQAGRAGPVGRLIAAGAAASTTGVRRSAGSCS